VRNGKDTVCEIRRSDCEISSKADLVVTRWQYDRGMMRAKDWVVVVAVVVI
jgi:hypothetical protein